MKAKNYYQLICERLHNYPRTIGIEITKDCPLNCVYCDRKPTSVKGLHIPTSRFWGLQEKIDFCERIIFCGGGETFYNKHIYSYIPLFKHKQIMLVTSGTIPITFESLHKYISILIFSVDAAKEKDIKRICGDSFNYQHFLCNIANACHYGFVTTFNTTISQYNLSVLSDILEFAADHKVKYVSVDLPVGNRVFIDRTIKEIVSVLKEMTRIARECDIILVNPLYPRCVAFGTEAIEPFIDMYGELYPCFEFLRTKVPIGNIFHNTFHELWTNQKYAAFRTGESCKTCDALRNIELLLENGMEK